MKRAWINVGVGVGCVGLLLSLLVPIVLRSREDARLTQCKNNLKQWGLALHNYHDTHLMFPPYAGGTHENSERLSGGVMLLPYFESGPLWDVITSTPGQGGDPMTLLKDRVLKNFKSETTFRITAVQPWTFLCPASVVPPRVDQQPHESYMFCAGDQLDFGGEGGVEDFPNRMKTRGAFGWRSCVSVRDILDGTTNTIAMAERDLGTPNDRYDLRGRVARVAATSPAACLKLMSNGRYLDNVAVLSELSGERWASGHPMYSVFLTAVPPNGPSCAASAPPSGKSVGGWFTASSRHTGGVQVLMCDGSVCFVNDNIHAGDLKATKPDKTTGWSSYGVWSALGTVGSGETINEY